MRLVKLLHSLRSGPVPVAGFDRLRYPDVCSQNCTGFLSSVTDVDGFSVASFFRMSVI